MPSKPAEESSKSRSRNPIIVISGPPGSGKTTYAKRIAENFSLPYHSAGQIFRSLAKQRGIDLVELSKIAESDPSIDVLIDKTTLEKALDSGGVIEGHLSAFVLADIADLSIYINAPLDTRVERISNRENRPISQVASETIKREESQYNRFRDLYGVDTNVLEKFDLVINTRRLSIDLVYHIIHATVKETIDKFKIENLE